MKLRRTTEDYLKTIYILSKTGEVHGAAIAERLGVSRPTVSISLKALKQEGYITQDDSSAVRLTKTGLEIARATYERHQTFQSLLENLGVDGENGGGRRLPDGARRQPGKLRGHQGAGKKKEGGRG